MTGIDLLQTKISYYYNVKYNSSYFDVTLRDWVTKHSLINKNKIQEIREAYNSNHKSLGKTLKAQYLPAVTITGVFHKTTRRIEHVTSINPIVAIDIDKDDNEHIEDWEELKKKIASIPYVFFTSYSCSGKGLFCLVYFNTELDFNKVFYSLQCDFKDMGVNIDENCKDITRLRFVSYDDNMLIRQGEVEQYNKEKEKPIELVNREFEERKMMESDAFIYKCIYHLIMVDKYRADKYDNWLANAFYLSTFGERGYILFMLLSQMSDNYDAVKATQKFRSCQKCTRYTKDCLVFYFKLLKDIYGKSWKKVIKDYVIE